jgi:hypothetical protein
MAKPVGRLRVDGGARLRKTLGAVPGRLEDLTALHKRIAELVAGRAEDTTPVGPAPFHIRDTIRAAGTKSAAIVRAGNNKKRGASRGGYALAVHWGYQTRKTESGARTLVKARPWISEAAQDLSPQWTGMYRKEVDRILKTVEGTTTP